MKKFMLVTIGFIIGAVDMYLGFSIVNHEAKKGDDKMQEIVSRSEEVGRWIENKCK